MPAYAWAVKEDGLDDLIANLPDEALVLDVGGWASTHPRADWVIDIGPWETRDQFAPAGRDAPERVTKERWVQQDICGPQPWPFEDDMFDFAICTQTLEDIRDPLHACSELSRVAKAGYVETPHAAIELTRGVESPLWCGWGHHWWLVLRDGSGLVFMMKPHHIHSPFWPAIPSPQLLHPEAARPIRLAWTGSLPAREDFILDHDSFDGRLREIAAESARPSTLAPLRRRFAELTWQGYRAGRRGLGRAARAASKARTKG
jgi:hypothetical protein